MATDQEIRDAGILYLPRQKYLRSPFLLPQNEDGDEDSPDQGNGIPFTNVGITGGGGGASPFGELLPTFTTESVSPTGGVITQDLLTLDEKRGNPAFMGTVPNPEDYPYSGPVQQFSQIGPNLYDVNPEGTITGQRTYKTPRTIGDQVYAASQSGGLGTISQEDLYKPSFFESFKDKFFRGKERGTLGDRLLAQSQGITSKIPLPGAALSYLRSPFNPESPTYNAAFPSQLNFLEAGTGTRVTGTSGNLKFTEGLNLIGRDPNTGGLKYGPGSVLFGKNVISGFGTNDYETALNDYISKMLSRGVLSKFQEAKLEQARIELANLLADQKAEFEKPGGTKDQVAEIQGRVDREENNINKEAAKNESPTGASLVNPNSAYGKKQGYTGGNPNPHTPTGWSGSSKGNKDSGGKTEGSVSKGGTDDTPGTPFRRGGLAGILGF
jgi:hypothetical protein